MTKIGVQALSAEFAGVAQNYAERLKLPLTQDAELTLQVGAKGLQLAGSRPHAPSPLRVDFIQGTAAHRRQFGGGNGQMIARAIGIKGAIRPKVLDATAGLGRDAFVLASLGCCVQMIEREPILAALLQDGLRRAAQDAAIAPIIQHMNLIEGDACPLMQGWTGEPPEVVYLDPMFPRQKQSAAVKKDLNWLRLLLENQTQDESALLDTALNLASHRVVVKRPRKAPGLLGSLAPALSLTGRSCRFDIYPKQKLIAR